MWKNPRRRADDFGRRRAVDFARGLVFAVFARGFAVFARRFVLVFDRAAVLVRADALLFRRAFRALRMVLREADFRRAIAIRISLACCFRMLSRGA